jgi:hypothetical protein
MSTIAAGYDFFETIPGETNFQFPNGLPIPADFFHKGSAPFMGTIRFEGVPIREFTDARTGKKYETGTTDTVMHRRQDVAMKSIPGSGTTEVELVQLSLRSCSPIEVPSGRYRDRWDVRLSVSRSKPSVGTMTINQTSEHGGHFATKFVVVPHFRFERLADGAERHLDMGALKIPADRQEYVARLTTQETMEVPWQDSSPEDERAVLSSGFVIRLPIYHIHAVIPARLPAGVKQV